MHLSYFPYCCGGKILAGLFPPPANVTTHSDKWLNDLFYSGNPRTKIFNTNESGNRYAPRDFDTFKQWLFELTDGVVIGFLMAVTSRENPKIVEKWLQDMGFEPQEQKYRKNSASNDCLIWIGDFNKVIKPRLEGITSKRPKAEGAFT